MQDQPLPIYRERLFCYGCLATSTLNKWRCHGGGPVFIKLGRAVCYRKEDLDNFLTVSAKRSTSGGQWAQAMRRVERKAMIRRDHRSVRPFIVEAYTDLRDAGKIEGVLH